MEDKNKQIAEMLGISKFANADMCDVNKFCYDCDFIECCNDGVYPDFNNIKNKQILEKLQFLAQNEDWKY